jgi:hypothetical protein
VAPDTLVVLKVIAFTSQRLGATVSHSPSCILVLDLVSCGSLLTPTWRFFLCPLLIILYPVLDEVIAVPMCSRLDLLLAACYNARQPSDSAAAPCVSPNHAILLWEQIF